MNKLIVSLSPHVHSGDSVEKNMYGVVIALVPALLCSLWCFGMGAAVVLLSNFTYPHREQNADRIHAFRASLADAFFGAL
jgi:Na+-translocating ferredoxin:NAD+ oxidoreductase RnfD subunit